MKRSKNRETAAVAAQCVCAALLLCSPALAGTPGSAAASFLRFTPSPRASGMGESYVSVAEDAYAAYWNPAGLAAVERPEVAATYNQSFADVAHQYVSFVYPLRAGSSLGLNITRLTVAPFQGYDAAGYRTEKVDSADMAVGAAYARTLVRDEIERPVLSVGGNLKFVSERLDDVSANALAADLGALFYIRPEKPWIKNLPGQEFRIGLAARNIGSGLKFDSTSFSLPMSLSLGTSWLSHPSGNSTLTLSLDQTVSKDDDYGVALGAEYAAFQLLALRLGYVTGQDMGPGIRFGVGFRLPFMDIDYSMSPFGDLGAMHKFGVAMRFGRPPAAAGEAAVQRAQAVAGVAPAEKIEKLREFADNYLTLARQDLRERRYVQGQDNIFKAFNLEPGLNSGEWAERSRRLGELNGRLKLKEMPEREKLLQQSGEQPDTACEAIAEYLAGHDLKALLLAHAAAGANLRGDALFEDLLNAIGDFTRLGVRRDEMLSRSALLAEKQKRSARAFYQRDFNSVVKECEEAILLDGNNHLCWTRLGSAYFLLGDKIKARSAYEKALEIKPEDQVTGQFMQSQGWK